MSVKNKCLAIKPDGEKCTNKMHIKCDNKYCIKHMRMWLESITPNADKIIRCNSRTQCDKTKPGIKAILPENYNKRKCENCLQAERVKTAARLKRISNTNKSLTNIFLCKKCSAQTAICNAVILKSGIQSLYCRKCFLARQAIESARKHRDRAAYTKIYEAKPERKTQKVEWRKSNPDKIYNYYTSYRAKKLTENADEYRKRCAENAKAWRDANPDSVSNYKQYLKSNVKVVYGFYNYRANVAGYNFDCTIEDFTDMVNANCYYCGFSRGKRLNGIDRLDNTIGYEKSNIVTCCKTCNMMKNSLNESTFILMCAHITHYNRMLKFADYSYVFNDYVDPEYFKYKYRAANKLNINFELSETEFYEIVAGKCYICGRANSKTHQNGIDRFENDLGYTITNSKTCCADCNYLKKDANHDDFLYKCSFIASHNRGRLAELVKNWKPSNFLECNINKLSKDQIIAQQITRKNIRHTNTMLSKTSEAIIEKMAQIRDKIATK